MKKLINVSLIAFLLISTSSTAQTKLPKSYVNVGVGAGMNYGILGTKTVIGFQNTGILIGMGYVPGGIMGYELGAQFSIDWFYINIGYGVIGSYQTNNDPVKPIMASNVLLGGMINVGQEKRMFVDLGIGHTIEATPTDLGPFGERDNNGITAVVGFGFRLGG